MPASPAPLPDVGPAFLRGLDDVTPQGHGWLAECPICRGLLEIVRGPDRWQLHCDTCQELELVNWLNADLHDQHPSGDWSRRLWRAIVLAPSLPICKALLRGEDVPVSALDPLWCRRFGIRRAA